MHIKHWGIFFLSTIVFLISGKAYTQYTETINSNRPGMSQGAFTVGTGVYQIETSAFIEFDKHNVRYTDTEIGGAYLMLRGGLLSERIELIVDGTYLYKSITPTQGNTLPYIASGFPELTAGVKYMIYDPFKIERKPNLYSYHANYGFDWRNIIPVFSVYAGANYVHKDNAVADISQEGFSPKFVIITQNNWGRWAWVNNFIADQLTKTYPSYGFITTFTHSFNNKISAFAEYQLYFSDLYSDDVFRGGLAFLVARQFQVDAGVLVNIKDTPSRLQFGAGFSYRLDFHKTEYIEVDDENSLNDLPKTIEDFK